MAAKTKRSTRKHPNGDAIEKVHQAYLTTDNRLTDGRGPSLAHLAKQFGLSPRDVSGTVSVYWELERCALHARQWHKHHGHGARDEGEFVRYYIDEEYSHLSVDGPEGRALAAAFARDTWRRTMAPALEWEAHLELERARGAYEAVENFRKKVKAEAAEARYQAAEREAQAEARS